jgi:hypothetical protein
MPRPEVFDSSARYWLANYGVTFESIPTSYDIFRLTKGIRVVTNSAVPLNSIRIETALPHVLPPKGSLLIWGHVRESGTTFQTTGHVAVVVNAGPGFVDIVEHNVYDGHICAVPTSAPGLGSPLQNLRRDLGSPLLHLHRDWGSPFPHLRRDRGLPLPTSAPGLGLALATSASGLWAHPCHICTGTRAD